MRILSACFGLLLAALVAGCGGSSPPDVAPVGVTVSAGDGRAEVRFVQEPGLQYWVFYAPGDTVSFPESMNNPGYRSVRSASSPALITGLVNGQQYAFAVGASRDGSKVGPTSVAVTATARPAGEAWSAASLPSGVRLHAVYFDGTRFLGVGAAGAILISEDGQTWTAAVSGTTSDLHAISFVNARYIAVGAGGTVLTSLDRISWTARVSTTTETLRAVGGLGNVAVAVGDKGTLIVSPDTSVWAPLASGTQSALLAIGGTADRLLIAGADGLLLTHSSRDLATWQPLATGTNAALRGVAASVSRFVAVGDGGTVITSVDGLSWSPVVLAPGAALQAITWGSRFVAVAADGGALLSDDGQSWRRVATGATGSLLGVAFGLGRYLAPGADGVLFSAR